MEALTQHGLRALDALRAGDLAPVIERWKPDDLESLDRWPAFDALKSEQSRMWRLRGVGRTSTGYQVHLVSGALGAYVHTDLAGVLHRVDGPAVVTLDEAGVLQRTWAQHGKTHRTGGPASYSRDPSMGSRTLSWYQHGKLHLTDGPAIVTYQSYAHHYERYVEGERHCEDGPATLSWSVKHQRLGGAEYWLRGVQCPSLSKLQKTHRAGETIDAHMLAREISSAECDAAKVIIEVYGAHLDPGTREAVLMAKSVL